MGLDAVLTGLARRYGTALVRADARTHLLKRPLPHYTILLASQMFTPFPTLKTERLILRQPAGTDAADLFEMRSDPQVMQYIPRPLAKTLDDMTPFLKMLSDALEEGKGINWAIELKDSGKVVGLIGYVRLNLDHQRAEVGYSLTRSFHRRGIMLEAIQAIINYGFDGPMKLHSIEAIVDADNIASAMLLERVGFVKEAYFREDFLHNGQFRNSVHYGLLQSDLQ